MNLKCLTNDELIDRAMRLVEDERRVSVEILWHLREIERRRLFASRGYSSLFDYVTQGLGYSSASAMRRINAMRALRDLPEVDAALKQGTVTLTTVSALQDFAKRKRASSDEKRELFQRIQGKSRAECERLFLSIAPEAVPCERERPVSESLTEIRFLADPALMKSFQRVRELTAAKTAGANYQELFRFMAEQVIKKHEAKISPRGKSAPPAEPSDGIPKKFAARAAPASLRRIVWAREKGCCGYRDPQTGKICGSRFGLELDHVEPWALGGKTTEANLRLLCRTHNQLEAERVFGKELMRRYSGNQSKEMIPAPPVFHASGDSTDEKLRT